MTTERRLLLTVDGKSYDVRVEDPGGSPVTVIVNGHEFQVDVSEPSQMTASEVPPSLAGPPGEARERDAAPAAGGVARSSASTGHVVAPMPGNVVDIRANPDQRVAKGDVLCYLEAMKMNNAIHAPADGVIVEVSVVDGQVVTHGQVLMTYAAR